MVDVSSCSEMGGTSKYLGALFASSLLRCLLGMYLAMLKYLE